MNASKVDLAGRLALKMTPDLAEYIANNFMVATQEEGSLSSFDATVWGESSGKLFVSTRGTAASVLQADSERKK